MRGPLSPVYKADFRIFVLFCNKSFFNCGRVFFLADPNVDFTIENAILLFLFCFVFCFLCFFFFFFFFAFLNKPISDCNSRDPPTQN